jgi:hypothetical protein
MVTGKTPCSKERETLLEIFLSEGEKANLPSDLLRHMGRCYACSRYWKSLSAVRSASLQEPLYSSFLRAKTLRRLAGRDQAFRLEWMPALVLAALLSLSLSFVIPVCLLAKVYSYWTSSTAAACGAALGTLLAGGLLITVASAVSLFEMGSIRFGNEEDVRVRR